MLSIGFVSAILGDHSLEEVFKYAADHQFKCIEIMCWPSENKDNRRYAGVSHINVDALDTSKINEIISLQNKYGVFISALGYYPNPLDQNTELANYYISHIYKLIEACTKLNIPVLCTFIGRDQYKSVAENLKLYRQTWTPIIEFAEKNKIRVAIENCPMLFTHDEWPGGKNLATTPAIWDQLFSLIPSDYLGLNYDPSHLIWQQMDEVQPLYDYAHKLFHIHLKDAKLYRNKLNKSGIMAYPLDYHSPKLPGLGDVRWSDFFSALTTVKYRGPVCIEVEDKAFEGSRTDVYAALSVAKNYVSKFLA